ncbi:hypothetical protein QE152_g32104 [Popillia japonica]|uniref:Uncharacterized protein n=1 Tax=Popillia japonica TaxID=7064 RepID=A0AAW1J0E1_POPJA
MTAAEAETAANKPQSTPTDAEEPAVKITEPSTLAPFSPLADVRAGQYQVCRPRTSPLTIKRDVHNESDFAKKTVALQYLQPAMLPTFYTKTGEPFSNGLPVGQETETSVQNSAKRREFDDSVTRMNVTLPLKAPKLAKPFPDPVKTMYSHTLSDQEKAEHMLAETKMLRTYAENMKNRQKQKQAGESAGAGASQQGTRNYSTFHNLPKLMTDSKGECQKPADNRKEPCGWVKKEKPPQAKKQPKSKTQDNTKPKKRTTGWAESGALRSSPSRKRRTILNRRRGRRDGPNPAPFPGRRNGCRSS